MHRIPKSVTELGLDRVAGERCAVHLVLARLAVFPERSSPGFFGSKRRLHSLRHPAEAFL